MDLASAKLAGKVTFATRKSSLVHQGRMDLKGKKEFAKIVG